MLRHNPLALLFLVKHDCRVALLHHEESTHCGQVPIGLDNCMTVPKVTPEYPRAPAPNSTVGYK